MVTDSDSSSVSSGSVADSPTQLERASRSGTRSRSNSSSKSKSAARSRSRSRSRSMSSRLSRSSHSSNSSLEKRSLANSRKQTGTKIDNCNSFTKKARRPSANCSPTSSANNKNIIVDDLSDVSDSDSMNNSDDSHLNKYDLGKEKSSEQDFCQNNSTADKPTLKKAAGKIDDAEEQLDFEAEESENGSYSAAAAPDMSKKRPALKETSGKDMSNEVARARSKDKQETAGSDDDEDELEEGEVTDDDEARPEEVEPKPICKFYSKGLCTWGMSCRFLHPGVMDKGNYTMFDIIRGPVPEVAPKADERNASAAAASAPSSSTPATETAWERGLRTAKEMVKRANKRKEQDSDFEVKKMTLTNSPDDYDKENGYYKRASPEIAAAPAPSPVSASTRHYPPTRSNLPPLSAAHDYMPHSSRYQLGPPHPHDYYNRRFCFNEAPESDIIISRERGGVRTYREVPVSRLPPPPSHAASSAYFSKYNDELAIENALKRHCAGRPKREVILQRLDHSSSDRGYDYMDQWSRNKPSPVKERYGKSRNMRKGSFSSGSSYSSSSTSSRSSSVSSRSSYGKSRSKTPRSVSRSHSPAAHSRSRTQARTRARPRSSSPPTALTTASVRSATRSSRNRKTSPLSGSPSLLSQQTSRHHHHHPQQQQQQQQQHHHHQSQSQSQQHPHLKRSSKKNALSPQSHLQESNQSHQHTSSSSSSSSVAQSMRKMETDRSSPIGPPNSRKPYKCTKPLSPTTSFRSINSSNTNKSELDDSVKGTRDKKKTVAVPSISSTTGASVVAKKQSRTKHRLSSKSSSGSNSSSSSSSSDSESSIGGNSSDSSLSRRKPPKNTKLSDGKGIGGETGTRKKRSAKTTVAGTNKSIRHSDSTCLASRSKSGSRSASRSLSRSSSSSSPPPPKIMSPLPLQLNSKKPIRLNIRSPPSSSHSAALLQPPPPPLASSAQKKLLIIPDFGTANESEYDDHRRQSAPKLNSAVENSKKRPHSSISSDCDGAASLSNEKGVGGVHFATSTTSAGGSGSVSSTSAAATMSGAGNGSNNSTNGKDANATLAKTKTSRREELLKQLRAVEDAIAKKRSKF